MSMALRTCHLLLIPSRGSSTHDPPDPDPFPSASVQASPTACDPISSLLPYHRALIPLTTTHLYRPPAQLTRLKRNAHATPRHTLLRHGENQDNPIRAAFICRILEGNIVCYHRAAVQTPKSLRSGIECSVTDHTGVEFGAWRDERCCVETVGAREGDLSGAR